MNPRNAMPAPVPQLTASSSSDITDRSWMERVICSMDLAGGYACSGAHDTSMDEMAIPIDDATAMRMAMEDFHIETATMAAETYDKNDQRGVPVMEMINASRSSPQSISTDQGERPPWLVDTISYDFATLVNILNDPGRNSSPLKTLCYLLYQDDRWGIMFNSMTPKEYASLIMAIESEFDRPYIAALIAPSINGGQFTHEYILEVLGVVADWSRAPLITKLLPLCKDMRGNEDLIKAELSEWEIVCTKHIFELKGNTSN